MAASIRLNRHNKTIKVVNRKGTIKLSNTKEAIKLKHTGKIGPVSTIPGPKGDKGDTGATGISTFVRVHHSSDPNVVRPTALYVEWVGSVAPVNATTGDTWIDTST